MFIRYFARTDESALGKTAAAYCAALVATGKPVCLCATMVADLRFPGAWSPFRDLLTTPASGLYVNVVCSEATDWMRCYTVGVKNALLLTATHLEPSVTRLALAAALEQYELAYAPDAAIAGLVQGMTGVRPTVVPLGTAEAVAAFRALAVF